MTASTLTDSQRETLALFDGPAPRTTPEVAERLDVGRRSAYERLERLVECDHLETKKVGANARVWWRPPASPSSQTTDDRSSTPNTETADGTEPAGARVGDATVTRHEIDQRHHEEDLRRQRDFTRQVLETAPVGVIVLDDDGTFRTANRRASELLGLDEAGSHQIGVNDVYDEDGRLLPPDERPYVRVFETGEPVRNAHLSVQTADRDRRWLSTNVEPMVDDDGTVSQALITIEDVTRLKAQTLRLQRRRDELESELEEVLQRVDDGFFALDEKFRFTYVNQVASSLLKRSPAELVGDHVWDWFEPGPNTEAYFEEAMTTQQPVSFAEYYEPFDYWFETQIYPSESGLSVYFRDVTEREERERELERYAEIIDAVDEPIYELDTNGRFTFVNESFVERSGYDEDELLGEHVSIGMEEADVTRVESKMTEFLADGGEGILTVEYEVVTKSGERIPTENRISLLTDEEGRVRGSAGMLWDVTERKERERELELYETVVSRMEDGVYVLDEESRFTTVNDAYVEMTGYDRETLLGAHCSLVIDDAVAEESANRLREIAAEDASGGVLEADLERADGSEIRAETRFTTLPAEDGETPRKVGVVRDVSERVARETELERQRERLAALNGLNRVVNDITDAVVEQSTRAEIESVVCEGLADAAPFSFAWIGEVDGTTQTVEPRSSAGTGTHLDDVEISVDPDDARSDGPTAQALLTGEVQVVQDSRSDERHDPWRRQLERHAVRSSAAVPVVHDGSTYGVLNVYAERERAFEDAERRVLEQLGEVVGHAIAAVERKRALLSDEVVELEFRISDVFAELGVEASFEGHITLDQIVPTGDDEFLVYGTAPEPARPGFDALADALPHWKDVTSDGRTDGTQQFELRLSEPPVLSEIASRGGYVEQAVLDDGDYSVVIHLPPTVDVRSLTEAVTDAYPAAELLAQRQFSRTADTVSLLDRLLEEELTERQRATLEAAYLAGYYEWPREHDGEHVAESLGVSSPTFHQHLRRAERKVLESVLTPPSES